MNHYDIPDCTVFLPSLPERVGTGLDTACPICERPAQWSVADALACTDHLGYVVDYVYAALNGLQMPAVRPVGGAA